MQAAVRAFILTVHPTIAAFDKKEKLIHSASFYCLLTSEKMKKFSAVET